MHARVAWYFTTESLSCVSVLVTAALLEQNLQLFGHRRLSSLLRPRLELLEESLNPLFMDDALVRRRLQVCPRALAIGAASNCLLEESGSRSLQHRGLVKQGADVSDMPIR